MSMRRIVLLACSVTLATVWGCSTSTDLGGTRIPNSRPETRLTGRPPTLLEASFAVDFDWTGSDTDGKIVGFQWKISDNGVDGISPLDTLTFDPLTGAELHPWRFTAANDSTFLVLADQADFPGDEHSRPRSFRSHTLFVRAVDDVGAVDPSPAQISFTATTLVPTCRAIYPGVSSSDNTAQAVPRTVNIRFEGNDSDFELRTPTKARFLWKDAIDPLGNPITGLYVFNQHYEAILDFEDPEWTEWIRYSQDTEQRLVQFKNRPPDQYFFFLVQVEDTAGARSVGRGYGVEVAHVQVRDGFYRPDVTLVEPFLSSQTGAFRKSDLAGGQPLNFIWRANADAYNGEIVSYRHGWDLIDVTDANDPGWAVPPGVSEQNLFATERAFQEGLHTFYLRVEDDSGQVTLIQWDLRVIPYVERDSQLELMVLDQVIDDGVQNWLDRNNEPRNDESYRNAYWHFLAEGAGGVADMNWDRDWFDQRVAVSFKDVVQYKAVLCYARTGGQAQRVFEQFRPDGLRDKFVWLTPYQQRGGNLFLVGAMSMESFLETVSNYMVPMIFDTRETTYLLNGRAFVVGFGTKELPDGTLVQRGPLMYPYATAGIAALDWTAPYSKTIYARSVSARFDRHVDCVGLKGITLDPEFKDTHFIGPGIVPDTTYTHPGIDWHDGFDAQADTMELFASSFPFREDEFVDSNISGTRSTPIILQECNTEEYPADVPNGMCIEPMFRGLARFDWLREYRRNDGVGKPPAEPDWPFSRYTGPDLDEGCGAYALTSYEGVARTSAKTNGEVFGYLSYKTIPNKPIQRADVYWGFDPYRFEHEGTKKAIRWVLSYFGLTINP